MEWIYRRLLQLLRLELPRLELLRLERLTQSLRLRDFPPCPLGEEATSASSTGGL